MSRTARRLAPAAVFRLAVTPEELPADLRLRSNEWGVLFSVTGRHTVAQIASTLGLERATLEAAFATLLERGLIEERALSLDEYLAAAATLGDDESISLGRFLRARGDRPGWVGKSETPPPASPVVIEEPPFEPLAVPPEAPFEIVENAETVEIAESAAIVENDATGPAVPAAAAPAVEFASTAPPARALRLRALLELLQRRAPSSDAGQLDVYRTFLRVDPGLLRRHGITTLRLADDRVVRDPELVAAIVDSAAQTLGGAVPDSVWTD